MPDTTQTTTFSDPLIDRYASKEMVAIFSREQRYQTWRELWQALAICEKRLGLPISDAQLRSIEKALKQPVDFARVEKLENEFKHDVMAHLHTFAELCPDAKPILHLGATSAYITDNADIILSRRATELLISRLQKLCSILGEFSKKYKSLRTVGYTHFQVALPTTVGRRAAYWLQDLIMDGNELIYRLQQMQLRGVKGTTGTQASFIKLFDGDERKVVELDKLLAKHLGFESSFLLTGQTYPRKADTQLFAALVGIAESTSKFAHDMRLLQHLHELEEPFGKQQVGSSAMPFKRNPILSERICSLARQLISMYPAAPFTAATQWLERSLDDSAARRLYVPQSFMLADSLLVLSQKIVEGIQVHEKVITRHLNEQLPFLMTEMLLMEGVKAGGDRQELHETIRSQAMQAFHRVTEEGKSNNLLERLAEEPALKPLFKKMKSENWEERFLVGRAESQVDDLLRGPLKKFLQFKA